MRRRSDSAYGCLLGVWTHLDKPYAEMTQHHALYRLLLLWGACCTAFRWAAQVLTSVAMFLVPWNAHLEHTDPPPPTHTPRTPTQNKITARFDQTNVQNGRLLAATLHQTTCTTHIPFPETILENLRQILATLKISFRTVGGAPGIVSIIPLDHHHSGQCVFLCFHPFSQTKFN